LNAYNTSVTILGAYDQHLGTSSIDNRWENDEKKAERGFFRNYSIPYEKQWKLEANH